MALAVGMTLQQGKYEIKGIIGQGGMGTVYQALNLSLGGEVAIKEFVPDPQMSQAELAQTQDQFKREARLLYTMRHVHLPRVLDYFEEAGRYYLVMDYLSGDTLADIIRAAGSPLPEEDVVDWGLQLCDVLGYLHAHTPPIIYRDLKPANVMVDLVGKVWLIDFGIARFFVLGRTHNTENLGTPGYASPEHYGKGQTGPAADLYSLGVLLHELLTSADPSLTPFTFAPVQQLNPAVSPELSQVVVRATQLQLDSRYQTATEFEAALQQVAACLLVKQQLPHPGFGGGKGQPGAATGAKTVSSRARKITATAVKRGAALLLKGATRALNNQGGSYAVAVQKGRVVWDALNSALKQPQGSYAHLLGPGIFISELASRVMEQQVSLPTAVIYVQTGPAGTGGMYLCRYTAPLTALFGVAPQPFRYGGGYYLLGLPSAPVTVSYTGTTYQDVHSAARSVLKAQQGLEAGQTYTPPGSGLSATAWLDDYVVTYYGPTGEVTSRVQIYWKVENGRFGNLRITSGTRPLP